MYSRCRSTEDPVAADRHVISLEVISGGSPALVLAYAYSKSATIAGNRHRRRVVALHFANSVQVKKLGVGPANNNVYLVTCPTTRESVVIDASAEPDRVIAAADGTKVVAIVLTHGHRDHIGALDVLRQAFGAPVGIHTADKAMLGEKPDFEIADGEQIRFGRQALTAIHPPGHTPGGLSFFHAPLLFSGDTLFPGGPGATAHALGNFAQVIESIRGKLFLLPDETFVLPGHGLDTTIGLERPSLEEWITRGW